MLSGGAPWAKHLSSWIAEILRLWLRMTLLKMFSELVLSTLRRALRICVELNQARAAVDQRAHVAGDSGHDAVIGSDDGMLHLHGFEHDQRLVRSHRLTLFHKDLDDRAAHGGCKTSMAGNTLRGELEALDVQGRGPGDTIMARVPLDVQGITGRCDIITLLARPEA